jgi:phosphoribosyl 1,2-cyclic phosphodiesterase
MPGTMKVISLQSGSNGNSFYVEADDVRLLFDAGITGRQAEMRLANHGRQIRDCHGLFITHDHSDHSRCMGVFHRKFGLPLYLTRKTLRAATFDRDIGPLHDVRFFKAGEATVFQTAAGQPVTVHSVPTPHDSAEGVAFVIEHNDKRVGILTDLGHVFAGLREVLLSLDAVVIESNYDPEMLEYGPYPELLKKRIRGRGGHISNHECAELISRASMFKRLKWACLCHLSEENNCPDLALATHRRLVDPSIAIHVASRYDVSDVMEV